MPVKLDEAARKAAEKILRDCGAYRLQQVRDLNETRGLRLIDYLYGLLTRAIHARLVPIMEALAHTADVQALYPGHLRTADLDAALLAAGTALGRHLMQGLPEVWPIIEEEMVRILYRDPSYTVGA